LEKTPTLAEVHQFRLSLSRASPKNGLSRKGYTWCAPRVLHKASRWQHQFGSFWQLCRVKRVRESTFFLRSQCLPRNHGLERTCPPLFPIRRNHCAVCHARTARPRTGNDCAQRGRPRSHRITPRNGGVFPTYRVKGVIDHTEGRTAHALREMPIWGSIFRSCFSFGNRLEVVFF